MRGTRLGGSGLGPWNASPIRISHSSVAVASPRKNRRSVVLLRAWNSGGPNEISICAQECDPTETSSTVCTGGEECYFYGGGPSCNPPTGNNFLPGAECVDVEDCIPGASCINDGTPNHCYEVCYFPGGTCDYGGACLNIGDPNYGICG